jgi:hypothetical protein
MFRTRFVLTWSVFLGGLVACGGSEPATDVAEASVTSARLAHAYLGRTGAPLQGMAFFTDDMTGDRRFIADVASEDGGPAERVEGVAKLRGSTLTLTPDRPSRTRVVDGRWSLTSDARSAVLTRGDRRLELDTAESYCRAATDCDVQADSIVAECGVVDWQCTAHRCGC